MNRRLRTLLWLTPLLVAQKCPSQGKVGGSGGASGANAGCGGEAASGGYMKLGGAWDGTAGNPYGYPQDAPAKDCAGFGFFSTAACGFFELCNVPCSTSSDCPTVADGPTPECAVSNDGQPSVCVLPCAEGGTCPDGMRCVVDPYRYGAMCMWPKTYGNKDAGQD